MDTLTREQRSERMSRVKGKDTRPEMIVRRLVHKLGYRYRLHGKGLPGHPDLVFASRRKALFVHGCFWHRHPDPGCCLTRTPKSRLDFWETKFGQNVERDRKAIAALREAGWDILIIWECQIGDNATLERQLVEFLGATR